jgi:hypothetical protein
MQRGVDLYRRAEEGEVADAYAADVEDDAADYSGGTATETRRPGTPNAWRVFSFDSRR